MKRKVCRGVAVWRRRGGGRGATRAGGRAGARPAAPLERSSWQLKEGVALAPPSCWPSRAPSSTKWCASGGPGGGGGGQAPRVGTACKRCAASKTPAGFAIGGGGGCSGSAAGRACAVPKPVRSTTARQPPSGVRRWAALSPVVLSSFGEGDVCWACVCGGGGGEGGGRGHWGRTLGCPPPPNQGSPPTPTPTPTQARTPWSHQTPRAHGRA